MKNKPLCRFACCMLIAGISCASGIADVPNPGTAPQTLDAAAAAEDGQPADPEADAFAKLLKSISWTTTGSGVLGSRAKIEVPDGYVFTGGDGTRQLMKAYGNLVSGSELGYIAPKNLSWFAVFEFDECGYVKDDEKDKLDADAILERMREGQNHANEELRKLGQPELTVLGWHTKPFYNSQTNNLEWAIRLASGTGKVINYKTKLLGRRGVMDVVLVCDEAQLATTVPECQKLLKGFAFTTEESYASFRNGDKVAEYGLTGLIVGGGLLVAAKSGLLAKLWKPIVVAVLAVVAFFKRIITGKTRDSI